MKEKICMFILIIIKQYKIFSFYFFIIGLVPPYFTKANYNMFDILKVSFREKFEYFLFVFLLLMIHITTIKCNKKPIIFNQLSVSKFSNFCIYQKNSLLKNIEIANALISCNYYIVPPSLRHICNFPRRNRVIVNFICKWIQK